jgi:hypothetical protein
MPSTCRSENMTCACGCSPPSAAVGVDSELVGVAVANFLLHEVADKLKPLRRIHLTGQRDFKLAVGRSVLALVGVGGFPKLQRVGRGPFRHIAEFGRLQLLAALKPFFVLADSSDIGGVRGCFPRLANLNAQSSNRHAFASLLLGRSNAACLTRREGRAFLVRETTKRAFD